MTVTLKNEHNKSQLLQALIEECISNLAQLSPPDFEASVRKHANLLGDVADLESLDSMLSLNMDMLNFQEDNYPARVKLFVQIQRFLYSFRRAYIRMHGLHCQPEYVLTGPQERVLSPGVEAFELMGNNKLDIRQSEKAYSLIFE